MSYAGGVRQGYSAYDRIGGNRASQSPYSTPLLIVKQKGKSNRYYLDFRKVNKHTVFDAEPMPDQEGIMAKIANSKYFSKLDLSKGYWQIPLDEESKKITAFQSNRGLLQFRMMSFGLVNASATFNRVMRILFYGKKNVETFVDDILVHTAEWEEHLKVLEDILSILQSSGLTARPTKCELGNHIIEYLGHTVGGGVIRPLSNKVASIINVKVPQSKKEV